MKRTDVFVVISDENVDLDGILQAGACFVEDLVQVL